VDLEYGGTADPSFYSMTCTGTGFTPGQNGSTTVYPTTTTTYTWSCTDPNGTTAVNTTVTVPVPAPVPTASLSASPTSITGGSSSTLTWGSTNATSCTGTNFSTGSATSGSVLVSPNSSTTYSVSCTGPGGTSSVSNATVTIIGSATISATDIVCNTESDLPDWNHGPSITQFTASNYVASHPNCHVQSGQNFEWLDSPFIYPSAPNNSGAAGGAWKVFGPTDSSGVAIDPTLTSNIGSNVIWIREQWNSGLYPFHGIDNTGDGEGTGSAEFWCNTNLQYYDNYEYLGSVNPGQTYYCVAFNVVVTQPDVTAGNTTPLVASAGIPVTLASTVSDSASLNPDPSFPSIYEVSQTATPANFAALYGTASANSVALSAGGAAPITAPYTFPSAGTWYVRACANTNTLGNNVITESNYSNNCGAWATVVVTDPLIASCSVTPASAATNAPVTWTALASGGTAPYTYTWGGSVSGNTSSISTSYATPGIYTGNITVHDSAANSIGPTTCSASGGGSPSVSVYSCTPTLTASPSTVNRGNTTILSWSENALCASSCVLSDGHTGGLIDTDTVTPPTPSSGNTDTYSVTCGAPANTNSTVITVNVPTATISASPTRVPVGATTALTWTSQNAVSCTITRNATDMGATFDTTGGTSITDPTPLTTQTLYKITCMTPGPSPATATATTVVNVPPGFIEF
jgi:hypothetical protein